MNPINRRKALKTTLLGSAAGWLSAVTAQAKLIPTPPEIEGPFYPVNQQKDKDFDLTLIDGHSESAEGQKIEITGEVVDTQGKSIEGAMVELWQANAAGRYAHPRDTSKAPLDPNFQGWSIVPSGEKGGFKFKTIKPGAYKVGAKWTRPPHIHFKITKPGYQPLTTQMYFPEDTELLEKDGLLQRKSKSEQALMISKSDQAGHYHYVIMLAKLDEAASPQKD
jgi:protocatechuate 3,4-dioxygenase beta subunit